MSKTIVPIFALAPHWANSELKTRSRPSGNLDLVFSICLGGSDIQKILFPAELKSQSARLAVVNDNKESDLAQVILKAIELKNVSKKMKQNFDKYQDVSTELRKQYSLALLRFKLAERKVYPNTCELKIIVEEPSSSSRKSLQQDLGSEDESVDEPSEAQSSEEKEKEKEEEKEAKKEEDKAVKKKK